MRLQMIIVAFRMVKENVLLNFLLSVIAHADCRGEFLHMYLTVVAVSLFLHLDPRLCRCARTHVCVVTFSLYSLSFAPLQNPPVYPSSGPHRSLGTAATTSESHSAAAAKQLKVTRWTANCKHSVLLLPWHFKWKYLRGSSQTQNFHKVHFQVSIEYTDGE